MFNTNLFTIRNVLVICAFALVWQVILSRANSFLHSQESTGVTA